MSAWTTPTLLCRGNTGPSPARLSAVLAACRDAAGSRLASATRMAASCHRKWAFGNGTRADRAQRSSRSAAWSTSPAAPRSRRSSASLMCWVAVVPPSEGALSGVVGTTPRKSLVWISVTDGFDHFVQLIRDLLKLVEAAMDAGEALDSPFPWLSTEVHDLAGVENAYEITTLDVEDLPRTPEWSSDVVTAAEILQRASFSVTGHADDAGFRAEVAIEGSTAGTIACAVTPRSQGADLTFGFDPLRPPTRGKCRPAGAGLAQVHRSRHRLLRVRPRYQRRQHLLDSHSPCAVPELAMGRFRRLQHQARKARFCNQRGNPWRHRSERRQLALRMGCRAAEHRRLANLR
jgi:hypothetical protein